MISIAGEVDADPLQDLLPEVSSREDADDGSAVEAGNSAFAIIENLLPRILARTGNGGHADAGRSGTSFASPSLAMMQPDLEDLSPTNAGLGSKLAVSVQNQEAHFKPIIEGLTGAPTDSGLPLPSEEIGQMPVNPLQEKLRSGGVKGLQPDSTDETLQAVAGAAADAEVAVTDDERGAVRSTASDRMMDRLDVQKQAPINGAKSEAASLPSSTLQHLARSIVEDAKGISEPQHPAFQHDGLNRVATARASAGVLRVLDLQLKPAELGLVTIRMRLSGDSIEMEIQAQHEETAELLRNDADKLSSLLRVSGYRPDVINIQSAESASHDRSSFHRPQQGSTGNQSFDQGAAAGQGNSSRHQGDRYGTSGRDVHPDGSEGLASGGSRSGGIYL
ncbi:flagellar hook-length control protein FliK [Microvirga lotononidis]|uniref:flagellar hook-length control protein FliK n=1 Tax=Microvirga lotononidis TaxID=864069 RepID=UPI0002D66F81|nr:flagellar hook-length control protein FliK [Microvirga lotononidis]WQO29572.1 flagellar hook-length control protein FliK [Microvirga lotononidis]